jgi:hypothetical protein
MTADSTAAGRPNPPAGGAAKANPPVEPHWESFEKEVVRFRFTNQHVVIGLLAILALAAYFSFKMVHTVNENERLPPPQYLAMGTIVAERATVLEQPLPTSTIIGELPEGAVAFILADRPQDWREIRAAVKTGHGRKIIAGWVRKADIRSPADIREPARALAREADQMARVLDVKWAIEEDGRYEVTGRVVSLTDQPVRTVKVIITFYDEKNNPIDQRFTYAGTEATLRKSNPVPFVFVGNTDKSFKYIICRAECRVLAPEAIVPEQE